MEAADGNATLPTPGGPTMIPGCDAPFSRPSAFGLFLTLAFCLLTQPQGTLVYTSRSKPPGLSQAILRLFPPYCLAETAVIVIYLTRSLRWAWREGHRPRLQVTRRDKWYQRRLSLNIRPFTSQMRMTAVALLSVRSGKQATLLATLRAQTPSQGVEMATTPHHTIRPGDATSTGADPAPGSLPRRRTTRLEEGITLGPNEVPHDEPVILNVDTDVLAHGQAVVDVVMCFSVLPIMAKLAFSVLSGPIQFTAWPLVVGWVALQAVLLIFHSGGDDGIDTIESVGLIRELRMMEKELSRPTAHRGFKVSSFLFIISCGSYMSHLANMGHKPEKAISAILGEYWFLVFVTFPGLLVFTFIAGLLSDFIGPPGAGVLAKRVATDIVAVFPGLAWIASMWAASTWYVQINNWCTENLLGIGLGLVSVLYACVLPIVLEGHSHLFVKAPFIAAGFSAIVMSYDVEGTCKPEWLDFLG